MSKKGHYNIQISVVKVDFEETPLFDGGRKGVTVNRVVSNAGKIEIKNTDFEVAKNLAGKHLELLTEFNGTDKCSGNE